MPVILFKLKACFKSFLSQKCPLQNNSIYRSQDYCKDYCKIAALKLIHNIARIHDKFNKNIFLKYFTLFILSFFFVFLYSTVDFGNTNTNGESIRNGFFIAPLITMMITHQEKYLNIFLAVFRVPNTGLCTDVSSKDYDAVDSRSLKVRTNLLKIRNNEKNFTKSESEIWAVIKETWIYSTQNRDSYIRENTQTLIIVAFILMLGYMLFILNCHLTALFFLIFSLLMLLNRLFLAFRAILKYYLISKVSILLNRDIEESVEKDMKEHMPKRLKD